MWIRCIGHNQCQSGREAEEVVCGLGIEGWFVTSKMAKGNSDNMQHRMGERNEPTGREVEKIIKDTEFHLENKKMQ